MPPSLTDLEPERTKRLDQKRQRIAAKKERIAASLPRRVHGISEISHLLGQSERKTYQQVESGELETFVLGGRRVATPEAIDRVIENARARGPQIGAPKGVCAKNAARAKQAKQGASA